jgi:glycosyltransferase involved in cell wall biosynthesis
MRVNYEVVYVDDGSNDSTPRMLGELQGRDRRIIVVHLSRNFGHQAAVSAGLDYARGQAVVVMDGDLQDPPEIIEQFIERWREGYEVVYAVRTDRKENWLKRCGYFLFYRLLRWISDLDIPLDSGDFCLTLSALVAIALTIWVLADTFHNHTAPRGWASTMLAVLFMGFIQLLSLGIMGEYLRRIFIETKARPTYILRDVARVSTASDVNDASNRPAA